MNKPDPTQLFESLKSIGFTLGLVTVLGKLLSVLVEPLFHVVMYVDLKIRKNDIEIPQPQLSLESDSNSRPDEPQNGDTN